MSTLHIILLSSLLICSFLSTLFLVPSIYNVVIYKLMGKVDAPKKVRKKIKKNLNVPSLGGIAFYVNIIIGIYLLQSFEHTSIATSLLPGFVILFMIGLKEDLVLLSVPSRIIAISAAIFFVLLQPEFQIQELHGVVHRGNLPLYWSLPISVFIMFFLISAYSTLDNMDGYATLVGLTILVIFALLFFFLKEFFFLGLCTILVGSLTAFLRFNLSKKKKISMGDTGSLLVGYVIAVCVIKLFSIRSIELAELPFPAENLPLIVLSILIIPILNSARYFTYRMMNRTAPLRASENHIHLLLLDYFKTTPKKLGLLIAAFNLAFILLFLILGSQLSDFFLLVVFLFFSFLFSIYFYRINFIHKRKRNELKLNKKDEKQ